MMSKVDYRGHTVTVRAAAGGTTYTVAVAGRTVQRRSLAAIRALIDRLLAGAR